MTETERIQAIPSTTDIIEQLKSNRPKIANDADITRRDKTFEDELLQKIQNEVFQNISPNLNQSVFDNGFIRDENRTNYEENLLAKVIGRIRNDEALSHTFTYKDKLESLMITSAQLLTDDEKERIVRSFIKKTGKNLRRITTVVDPTLITGVRIQTETYYYEVSGKKQLREIRSFLEESWLQGDES